MSEAVRDKSLVSLAYTLSDTKGHVLDERTPENPLEYVQGNQQILPAVEKALEGQYQGFQASLHLQPHDAYGDYDASLVAEMSRTEFPSDVNLQVGMKFSTKGPDGEPLVVRIIDVDEEIIVIDGNHPLAGMELLFEVRVLGVQNTRDAEIAEIEINNSIMPEEEEFEEAKPVKRSEPPPRPKAKKHLH